MIQQVKMYLKRIDAAKALAEKQTIAAELQAFYETLTEEKYQFVKEKLLTPRLDALKVRMAELDKSVVEVSSQRDIT